jgi:hypothetical protein
MKATHRLAPNIGARTDIPEPSLWATSRAHAPQKRTYSMGRPSKVRSETAAIVIKRFKAPGDPRSRLPITHVARRSAGCWFIHSASCGAPMYSTRIAPIEIQWSPARPERNWRSRTYANRANHVRYGANPSIAAFHVAPCLSYVIRKR